MSHIFADNAVKYGTLGWAIFPLAEGEKVPMAGTNGFKSASADQAQLAEWSRQHPHANIGIATGRVSRIVVIDFDPRSGSDETTARLAKEGKVFGDTVECISPRDGRHLYYAYDPRVTTSKTNALGPGIDIKTDGGYVVGAPSVWCKNGKSYRWLRPPRGVDLPSLPPWVVSALQPKPEPTRRPMKQVDLGNLRGYRRQAMADLVDYTNRMAALHDGRHEAPFKVASAVGKYVHHRLLSVADLVDAVMSACSANGAFSKYTPTDIKSQIMNGLKKASNDGLPPLAHPYRFDRSARSPLDRHAGDGSECGRRAGDDHSGGTQ